MANYLIKDTTLTNIADAIRTKTGSTDTLSAAEMPKAIIGIEGESSNNLPYITGIVEIDTGSTDSFTIPELIGYNNIYLCKINLVSTFVITASFYAHIIFFTDSNYQCWVIAEEVNNKENPIVTQVNYDSSTGTISNVNTLAGSIYNFVYIA